MCIDYSQLNQRTIKDSYALPRIEEILYSYSLSRSMHSKTIDKKSGYHQVEFNEDDKARTAFTIGPVGFYEYNRMPFELVNAPATYQRLIEECLGDLIPVFVTSTWIILSCFQKHLRNTLIVCD